MEQEYNILTTGRLLISLVFIASIILFYDNDLYMDKIFFILFLWSLIIIFFKKFMYLK